MSRVAWYSFDRFFQSLRKTRKVECQVRNSILERIWHSKRFYLVFHHKFNWMSSVHAETIVNLWTGGGGGGVLSVVHPCFLGAVSFRDG